MASSLPESKVKSWCKTRNAKWFEWLLCRTFQRKAKKSENVVGWGYNTEILPAKWFGVIICWVLTSNYYFFLWDNQNKSCCNLLNFFPVISCFVLRCLFGRWSSLTEIWKVSKFGVICWVSAIWANLSIKMKITTRFGNLWASNAFQMKP